VHSVESFRRNVQSSHLITDSYHRRKGKRSPEYVLQMCLSIGLSAVRCRPLLALVSNEMKELVLASVRRGSLALPMTEN